MDKVKFYPNERLDIGDIEAITDLVWNRMSKMVRSLILPDGRNNGEAGTPMRVLSGFGATISTTSVKIEKGKAIMSSLDGADAVLGVVHGEDTPEYILVDMTYASVGANAIYVRFVLNDADARNRVFWNSASTPPGEEIDNVNTRARGTWEATFRLSSLSPPGDGEWMKIWEVDVAPGPVLSNLVDYRHMFFEGDSFSGYAHEWGTGNDRDTNRSKYGVGDLHKFAAMVRTQIADIIGIPAGGTHLVSSAVPVELESLSNEHYGELDAPTSADRGRHKDIILGDTGEWWEIAGGGGGTPSLAQTLSFEAKDAADNARLSLEAYHTAKISSRTWSPEGSTNLPVGHVSHDIVGVGNDFEIYREVVSAAGHKTIIKGGGRNTLTVRSGTDFIPGTGHKFEVGEGVVVNANEGAYMVTQRQVAMLVPLTTTLHGTAGSWYLQDYSGVGNGATSVFGLASGGASDVLNIIINDFPEGARLDYIDVGWGQSAGSSGSRNLRMYAGRQTVDIHHVGDASVSGASTNKLNTTQDYIENTTFSGRICQRFTVNINNLDWTRSEDVLAIGLYTGDDASVTYSVTFIRCVWTFSQIMGYPISSDHTP